MATAEAGAEGRAYNTSEHARLQKEREYLIERANAMLHELRAKDPVGLCRKICMYIAADNLPEDDPVLQIWGAFGMRHNYRETVRPRFRFLAEEILATTSHDVEHELEGDTYSLYEFARRELRCHLGISDLSIRLATDRIDLADPHHFVWEFFRYARQGLDIALSGIADLVRYGLPVYECCGSSLTMLPDDDERIAFLRVSSTLGGLPEVYEPPDWTRTLVIKRLEHRLANWIFNFDSIPSDNEVTERRQIFRSQLGLDQFVRGPTVGTKSTRGLVADQVAERADGVSLQTALKLVAGLIALLKVHAVPPPGKKAVSQEVIQQWLIEMFPNRLPVDRQLDSYFALANRTFTTNAK